MAHRLNPFLRLLVGVALVPAFVSAVPAQQSVPVADPVRRYEGLGTYRRPITTEIPEAQIYFDQGLAFLYAFNHDEAIRAFQHATELDPKCAMAFWGLAMANGPHINKPEVPFERAMAGWKAVYRAEELRAQGTAVEQALIEALAARYSETPPEDRSKLNAAYADRMRDVHARFPDDADVAALFAESLLDLRPWDYWTREGAPQPGTTEALAALEAAIAAEPNHPLALHLYIHAVEASPTPELADDEAERLRDACPGLGHLVHMPSHIDIRRGRWQEAIEANQRAIQADANYRKQAPPQGFYRIYMGHNYHMLAFAALMQGESARSLSAIRKLLADIPDEWTADPANAQLVDGYYAMPIEVLVRFGRWDEVLQVPEPAAIFPVARALRYAARATALSALGRSSEARQEQATFRDSAQAVPQSAVFGNNTAADLFAVADPLLEGELLAHEKRWDEGIAKLREAVIAEDRLKYDEPPDWILPVRHALGATLLQANDPAAAELVYREDLKHWPDNGWSLFGLARSLEAQGKSAEAAATRRRFEEIWQHADVELTSSCYCQPGEH